MLRHTRLMVFLLVLALAGCRSKQVSRNYSASYDNTWNAAVYAARDITGAEPVEADRSTGRLVTPWTFAGRYQQDTSSGPVTNRDQVRGVITVSRIRTGSRVSVAVEQRTLERGTGDVDTNRDTTAVQYPINSKDTTWQRYFLDKVGEYLRRRR